MNSSMTIRTARIQDAPRLLEIYSYYIENTAVTFEYDVPTLGEFESRIENTLKKYPYLVLEQEGRIIGYAYAGAFHPRAAFAWCAEVTVYLDRNSRRSGGGRILYSELERILSEMGIINAYACVAFPEAEDEYLTMNSLDFHKHTGYTPVGEFPRSGYKFGRWYNMSWMEKFIGEHKDDQPEVIPFPDVSRETVSSILKNVAAGVTEKKQEGQ